MKRFVKALSLLVAAAVLTVSVSSTVSAATSSPVGVNLVSSGTTGGTTASGVSVNVIVSYTNTVASDLAHTEDAEEQTALLEAAQTAATSAETAAEVIDGGLSTAASDLGVQEDSLQFTTVFNIYVENEVSGEEVTVTLQTQLSAGTAYVIGQYTDGTWTATSWGYVAEDGTVTITGSDLSASSFAIITVSEDTTSGVESPQTGGSANALMLASVALVAIAAAVAVSGRKVTR